MEEKIRARSFSRRFLHMRGTIWEWNVEKLEGGGSQILQTSHLHGVSNFKQDLALALNKFFSRR